MLRSMMTVSGFTLVSRVLGFLRDILIGFFVGTGPVADAFVAAFRFPNMFRRIFGEGAFNSAFVPLFGRKLEEEGVSFRAIQDELREQLAGQLLESTEMKLDELALRLGYTDTASFTRAFRRWKGVSPGKYRAQSGG